MKAILLKTFGDADQLYMGEVPRPNVKSNQVLIKVSAAALNRADVMQRQGFYPPPTGGSDILGLEVSGVVEDTGDQAKHWQGKQVMSLLSGGGYAEYVAVDEGLVLDVPENISLITAAGIMEAFLTAFQALHWIANIQRQSRVLIHAAASGVGTAAIQLAKQMDAEVWATASAGKHALCSQLGADHCIDYRTDDFAEYLSKEVPQGMHIIMDFIGGPYFTQNLQALAMDGKLVMQGSMGGTKLSSVNLAPILRKRLTIEGSTLRSRSLDYRRALINAFREKYYQKIADGSIKPVIDTVFDWQEVQEAHRYMEMNRNKGKIILSL